MRAPWTSPSSGSWSWTTFWVNLAAFVTIVRLAVGDGLSYGDLNWQPGEMEAMLPTGILAALGSLYYGRRKQENGSNGAAATATDEDSDGA